MSEQVSFEILSEQGAPANEYSSLVGTEREKKQGLSRKWVVLMATTAALLLGAVATNHFLLANTVARVEDNYGEVGAKALLNCPNHGVDLSGDDNILEWKVCATADYFLGSICQWQCKFPDADGTRGIRSMSCVNHAAPNLDPLVTWEASSDIPGAAIPNSVKVCPEAPCEPLSFDLGAGLATGFAMTCDAAGPPYASGAACSFTCNDGTPVTATCLKNVWTTSVASCGVVPPNTGVQCGTDLITLNNGAVPRIGAAVNVQNRPDQKLGLYRVEMAFDFPDALFERLGQCSRIAPDEIISPTGVVTNGNPELLAIQFVYASVVVNTPVGTTRLNFPEKFLNARYLAVDPDYTLPQSIGSTTPATQNAMEFIWPAYDPIHVPPCVPFGPGVVGDCSPVIAFSFFGFNDLITPGSDKNWWPTQGDILSFAVTFGVRYGANGEVFHYTTDSGPVVTAAPVYGGGIGKVPLVVYTPDPCNTGPDPKDAVPGGIPCPAPMTGTTVPAATPPAGVVYYDGAALPVVVPEAPADPAAVVP